MALPMAVGAQTPRVVRKLRLPAPLVALLVVSAVLGAAWAGATPPLQGPDEEAHLGYAEYLAETGRLPSLRGASSADSGETVAARTVFNLRRLIGNVSARPAWGAADRRAFDALAIRFTAADRSNGAGPNPMEHNPPAYYAYEAVPYWVFHWADAVGRQLAMRLASVLLGVLTVGLTWLLAAEVTPRIWVRFVAAAFVALHPQLAFIGATINPDALLAAVSTAFVLVAVRLVLRGPSPRRMLALGATAGLAVLTHGRGFAFVPAAVVIAIVSLARARVGLRGAGLSAAAAAGALAACVAASVVVTGDTGGAGAFGGELRQNASAAGFHVRQFLEYVWQFYLPRLGFMRPALAGSHGYRELYVEGFYGTFGSLEVRFSPETYNLLAIATTVGLAGLVAASAARWRELLRQWPVVVALATTVVCVIGLLHLAAYRDRLGDPAAQLLVGRYLLPLISIAGLAVA